MQAFPPRLVLDRRLIAMLGLGFGSGLPLLLVYVTQSAWLSESGVPVRLLGLLSELTLAYKLKFLWAPFLDRYDPPLLGRWLGRRRGWIVVAQAGVMAALAGVASGDPVRRLGWTIGFSLALGFAGATQDVVIDGWRIAATPPGRQAAMATAAEAGWRVGNLAAGAGALYLADRMGWRGAYLVMAGLMLPGMAAALLAPEPERRPDPKADGTRMGLWETIAAPIRELAARLGDLALPVLLLVAGFRMPGYVASAMAMPLFKALHYSNTDIATVTKIFGFGVALAGTAAAGRLAPRLGMMRGLLVGTVFGSASHLSLAWLAWHGDHGGQSGHEFWLFALAVGLDGFAYAFASIVLIAYMSRLAAPAHAASQYALLTSLCAIPGGMVAAGSGFVVERLGFPLFFVATSLIGVPVAWLAWHVGHLHRRPGDGAGGLAGPA